MISPSAGARRRTDLPGRRLTGPLRQEEAWDMPVPCPGPGPVGGIPAWVKLSRESRLTMTWNLTELELGPWLWLGPSELEKNTVVTELSPCDNHSLAIRWQSFTGHSESSGPGDPAFTGPFTGKFQQLQVTESGVHHLCKPSRYKLNIVHKLINTCKTMHWNLSTVNMAYIAHYLTQYLHKVLYNNRPKRYCTN